MVIIMENLPIWRRKSHKFFEITSIKIFLKIGAFSLMAKRAHNTLPPLILRINLNSRLFFFNNFVLKEKAKEKKLQKLNQAKEYPFFKER